MKNVEYERPMPGRPAIPAAALDTPFGIWQ
jgi:hypothetical protein